LNPLPPARKAKLGLWAGLLGYKVLLLAVGVAGLWWFDAQWEAHWDDFVHGRWQSLEPFLRTRLTPWDGKFYLEMTAHGYVKGEGACAFYPLWPALIRLGSYLTGGNAFVAGLVLANLLSVLAWWNFHAWVAERHGRRVANLSLLFLLVAPGAAFFHFIYTESLFLLLLILFFRFLMRGRYGAAALVGFFLPLTKAIGIFCLAPLAWEMLTRKTESRKQKTEIAQGGYAENTGWFSRVQGVLGGGHAEACTPNGLGHAKAWKPSGEATSEIRNQESEMRWWRFGWLGLPLLGYAAYFGAMWAFTGDPFEGFKAQRFYPNQPSLRNIVNVAGIARAFFNVGSFHTMMTSGLDRGLFVLFLFSLPFIWRLNRTYFWYALFAGAVPGLSTWFVSYTRNVMMCFPLFILIAQRLEGRGRGWLVWYYAVLLAGAQALLAVRYVNREWAG
jgi:hypothetical protein